MFSLWFIGRTSESILGRKRFILLYFVSAVFAGLLSVLLSWYFGFGILERVFGSPNIAMVGASGAIFGLAGVLAALIPRSRVYLLAGPLFAIIVSSVLEKFVSNSFLLSLLNLAVTAYILICLFSIFSFNPRYSKLSLPLSIPLWCLPFVAIVPLMIASIFVEMYIGNVAHLGGFLVGLIYGLILRSRYPQKTRMLQRMFR
jgi:membrane associated rhomboid family serine protease